jgi:hypothetical protein
MIYTGGSAPLRGQWIQLAGARIRAFDSSGDPEYAREPGGAPSGAPGTQTFWAASSSGVGEQTLEWDPEDGDWRAVVMNEDASRDVAADMSIGAELDSVLWIGIGLLVLGALLAAGAALAITAGLGGADILTTAADNVEPGRIGHRKANFNMCASIRDSPTTWLVVRRTQVVKARSWL